MRDITIRSAKFDAYLTKTTRGSRCIGVSCSLNWHESDLENLRLSFRIQNKLSLDNHDFRLRDLRKGVEPRIWDTPFYQESMAEFRALQQIKQRFNFLGCGKAYETHNKGHSVPYTWCLLWQTVDSEGLCAELKFGTREFKFEFYGIDTLSEQQRSKGQIGTYTFKQGKQPFSWDEEDEDYFWNRAKVKR